MKKIFPFLLLAVFIAGCNNEPEARFEMVYERDFSIPAGLNNFETHYFYLRDISIGTYLTNNNVTADELISINPGSARLSTIFSGLSDYSFIRQVEVKIYTDDESNAREIFYRIDVPLNTGEDLDIIPSLIDARQFLGNTKFNVFVKLDLRAVPQQTVETKFRFSFLAK